MAFKPLFPAVYLKMLAGYRLSFLKDKRNVLILSLKHLNVDLNPDQLQKKPKTNTKKPQTPNVTAEKGTAKTNIQLTLFKSV